MNDLATLIAPVFIKDTAPGCVLSCVCNEHREEAQVSGVVLPIKAEEERSHAINALCIQDQVACFYSF